MSVQIFTAKEFAKILPKNYIGLGAIKGEYCFFIPYKNELGILVRSSVGENGLSKETGQDSIRAFIVKNTDNSYKFFGGKIKAYVTRVSGWEERTKEMISKLTKQLEYCIPCPNCNETLVPFTVKDKKNKNCGRNYVQCMSGICKPNTNAFSKVFLWCDEPLPKQQTVTKKEEITNTNPNCPQCGCDTVRLGNNKGWRCNTKDNKWDGSKWSVCNSVIWDNPKKPEIKKNITIEELKNLVNEALEPLWETETNDELAHKFNNSQKIRELMRYCQL